MGAEPHRPHLQPLLLERFCSEHRPVCGRLLAEQLHVSLGRQRLRSIGTIDLFDAAEVEAGLPSPAVLLKLRRHSTTLRSEGVHHALAQLHRAIRET